VGPSIVKVTRAGRNAVGCLERLRRAAAAVGLPLVESASRDGIVFALMREVDVGGAGLLSPEHLGGALRALHRLHQEGLVHRDLKASNLGWWRQEVVLLDLEDCWPIGEAPPALRATPTHLAPELGGGGVPTPRSDLFALGRCFSAPPADARRSRLALRSMVADAPWERPQSCREAAGMVGCPVDRLRPEPTPSIRGPSRLHGVPMRVEAALARRSETVPDCWSRGQCRQDSEGTWFSVDVADELEADLPGALWEGDVRPGRALAAAEREWLQGRSDEELWSRLADAALATLWPLRQRRALAACRQSEGPVAREGAALLAWSLRASGGGGAGPDLPLSSSPLLAGWHGAVRMQQALRRGPRQAARVLAELETADDAQRAGWAGMVAFQRGDWAEAVAAHRRASETHLRPRDRAAALSNLASALLHLVRFHEARAAAGEALQLSRDGRHPVLAARALWKLRETLHRSRETTEPWPELERELGQVLDAGVTGLAILNEAALAFRCGRLELAAQLAQKAATLTDAGGLTAATPLARALAVRCGAKATPAMLALLEGELVRHAMPGVAAQGLALLSRGRDDSWEDAVDLAAAADFHGDVPAEVLSGDEVRRPWALPDGRSAG
jgi:tetratricopeptide (TPR) repeat protein